MAGKTQLSILLACALQVINAQSISFGPAQPNIVSIAQQNPGFLQGITGQYLPAGLPYSENISPQEVSEFLSRQSAYYASVKVTQAPAIYPSAAPTTAAPHTSVVAPAAYVAGMRSYLSSIKGKSFPELSDCVFDIFAAAFGNIDVDLCQYGAAAADDSLGVSRRVKCLCSTYGRDVVTGVFPATACPFDGYRYASSAVLAACSNVAHVQVPASDIITAASRSVTSSSMPRATPSVNLAASTSVPTSSIASSTVISSVNISTLPLVAAPSDPGLTSTTRPFSGVAVNVEAASDTALPVKKSTASSNLLMGDNILSGTLASLAFVCLGMVLLY